MNLQSVKQRFSIIGKSEKLDRALSTAVRVASTDLTVMIQGESGVGKEVFSKIIHELSKRKHSKFIAINCGAIPAGTINSELFGHEKGAFTGATADRKGYFETVNGGTIFLDEIGEMPLDTQSYLLRILESGEFIRVGSSKIQKTDVRVIAATNISLLDQIKKGKFREDLYYRLNTVPIRVPSLKERREDIYMLFRKFAVDFSEKYRTNGLTLTPDARTIFENYSWPGNVRELKNVVEQLSVLSNHTELKAEDLIDIVPHIRDRNLPAIGSKNSDFASFEEREILYKFLLEMKADLSDLKGLVFELIRNNDLRVPDTASMKQLAHSHTRMQDIYQAAGTDPIREHRPAPTYFPADEEADERPIILHQDDDHYHETEIVEENLSIEVMEKELITKALKKYKGRRKDAAEELGISERTLYRKIKQYEIPD